MNDPEEGHVITSLAKLTNNFTDPDYKDVPWRQQCTMGTAFELLVKLSEDERKLVMRWFCSECYIFLDRTAGEVCHCRNDE